MMPRAQAAAAQLGAPLSAGAVSKITKLSGGIINPVTTSATILVADAASPTQPLLASTHPEWSAPLFLNTPAFPFVATRLASYLAPVATQSWYSAAEPTIAAALPYVPAVAADVSMAALPLVMLTDALFVGCLAAYSLAQPLVVAATLTPSASASASKGSGARAGDRVCRRVGWVHGTRRAMGDTAPR
jgi:hypothetical protein